MRLDEAQTLAGELCDVPIGELLRTAPARRRLLPPQAPAARAALDAALALRLCGDSPGAYDLVFGVSSSSSSTTSSGTSGSACAHVFQRGEGVYRCRTCALDETCVFCARCFRATSHDGHDTSFSIAAAAGGCCDCGDPEAWKLPIHCKFHSKGSHPLVIDDQSIMQFERISLPQPIVSSIRSTISSVLEFIIATFARMPSPIAPVQNASIIADQFQQDSQGSMESSDTTTLFSCLLWNDEAHSYAEVIDQVMDAINCSEAQARAIADTVDKVGRQAVASSDNLPLLVNTARIIERIGLVVSIAPTHTTIRQDIAASLVDWLKSIPKIVAGPQSINGIHYESVERLIRSIICEELYAPLASFLHRDPLIFPPINHIVSAIPASALPVPPAQRSRIDYLLAIDSRLWKHVRNSLRELYIGSLLVSGDAFKRSMGSHFADSYLEIAHSYLFRDREYDLSIITFSVQLFTVPTIARHLLSNTTLLPVIFSFLKAYFLSDVSSSGYALKDDSRQSILRAANNLMLIYPTFLCDGESVKHRRYWPIFNDIRYLLNGYRVSSTTPPSTNASTQEQEFNTTGSIAKSAVMASQIDPVPLLTRFLDLCMIWQGMHPQRRSVYSHIEFETEYWLNAFNLSLNASRFVRQFSDCFFADTRGDEAIVATLSAISETRDFLLRWSFYYHLEATKEIRMAQASVRGAMHRQDVCQDGFHDVEVVAGVCYRVPDFRVAFQPVSFHNPLHWFLACLMRVLTHMIRNASTEERRQVIVRQVFDMTANTPEIDRHHDQYEDTDRTIVLTADQMAQRLSPEDRMTLIFDFALRTIVFVSQIKAGVWVRNGASMRGQAIHYKDATLRDCYDRDVLLLQFAAATLGSDKFLTMLVDRFDLVAWFQGHTTPPDQLNHEPAHIVSAVQDMLQTLITIVSERSAIGAVSVIDELRREIVHYLAAHQDGLPYSELTKRISEELLEAAASSGSVAVPTPVDRNAHADNVTMGTVNGSGSSGDTGDNKNAETTQSTTPISKKVELFDAILMSVAHFRSPDGASDTGVYELKDQFYTQVDPWFWHYSRNEREEVEETLRRRSDQKRTRHRVQSVQNTVSDSDDVRRPELVLLQPGSGFDRTATLVHSPIYTQLVFYALWNVTRTVKESGIERISSELIFAEAVHLLVLGFDIGCVTVSRLIASLGDTSNGFITNAVCRKFVIPVRGGGVERRSTSLLELVLSLVDRADEEDVKEQASRLRYLVQRFEESGGDEAKAVIRGWRDKSRWDFGVASPVNGVGGTARSGDGVATTSSTTVSDTMTEHDRKKQASKARQAAIMAQFAQAQKSFVANYGELMDDIGDDDDMGQDGDFDKGMQDASTSRETRPDERTCEFPGGTCIVCQEETNQPNRLHGLLCYLQQTTIRRHVNFANPGVISQSVSPVPVSLDVEMDRQVSAMPVELQQGYATLTMPVLSSDPIPYASEAPVPSSSSSTSTSIPVESAQGSNRPRIPPIPLKRISIEGLTATSCGHVMHLDCFQTYMESIIIRHQTQPQRNQPENLEFREFMCPLCKSLGNVVLPVVWTNRVEKVNWNGSSSSRADAVSGELDDQALLASLRGWLVKRHGSLDKNTAGVSREGNSDATPNEAPVSATLQMQDDYRVNAGPLLQSIEAAAIEAASTQGSAHISPIQSYVSDFVHKVFDSRPTLAPATITYTGPPDISPPDSIRLLQHAYLERFYNVYAKLTSKVPLVNRAAPLDTGTDASLFRITYLWDLFAYTICSVEILSRGAPSTWTPPTSSMTTTTNTNKSVVTVGVLDTTSTQMRSCLRLLSETALGAIVLSWDGAPDTLSLFNRSYMEKLLPRIHHHHGGDVDNDGVSAISSDGRHRQATGSDTIQQQQPSTRTRQQQRQKTHDHVFRQPPAMLRDGVSHLVVLSMCVIPSRDDRYRKTEQDVFMWVRLLWVFELVRTIVSVIESVLLHGEDVLGDGRVIDMLALRESMGGGSVRVTGIDVDVMDGSDVGEADRKGKQPAYIVVEPVTPPVAGTPSSDHHDQRLDGLRQLIHTVIAELGLMPDARKVVEKAIYPALIRALFERVGLMFARRCVLLLYARFGLVPPGGVVGFGFDQNQRNGSHGGDSSGVSAQSATTASSSTSAAHHFNEPVQVDSELDRLCAYLGLPTVATLVATPITSDPVLGDVVHHWLSDFGSNMANHYGVVWPTELARRREQRNRATTIMDLDAVVPKFAPLVPLEFPAVYELVHLPTRHETLFEASRMQPCRRCNTIPTEPALCLLCGTFVCGQSYCCSNNGVGECNMHMAECAGSYGIYLLVKEGAMLLLHNQNGYFVNPPYLDAHGEVDLKLRRGRPLFLNRRRYDETRKQYLTHGIASYIARKIEQTYDTGGWESL